MKRILLALLALAAVASAACRIYDVDVARNVNGWTPEYPSGYVEQSFVCTADSLLWAEAFIGSANSGGQYDFVIQTLDRQELYYGDANAGDSAQYQYIHATLLPRPGAPGLIKGETYVLKVTCTAPNESLNYFYDEANPYQYGELSLSGNAQGEWDLCARIEGINRPVGRDFFGVTAGSLDPRGEGDNLQRIFALMDSAGIREAREFFWWSSVQPGSAKEWNWDRWDRVFETGAADGIEFLPCLSNCPSWASSGDFGSAPDVFAPEGLFVPVTLSNGNINPDNYWGNFVYQTVQRYKPDGSFFGSSGYGITDWEIWNEPNYWRSPQRGYESTLKQYPDSAEIVEVLYARACDVALQAARLADPAARVFVGSLGGTFYTPGLTATGMDWLAGYYLHREDKSYTGVSAHPYQYGSNSPALQPDTFRRDLDTLRAVMKNNGDEGKQLIATELAWSGVVGAGNLDFSRPALSIPEAHVMSLAGDPVNFYDRIYWIPLWNINVPPNSSWSNELLHVNQNGTFEKRASYHAYRQMTRELLGKRMNGRVLSGDSATDAKSRVYELEDTASGRKTWVGWRNYEKGAAAVYMHIPTRTDQLDIAPLARSADADRLSRTLATGSDGWLGLELDTIPVYVHETGAVSRPDLKVDSVWTTQVNCDSETQVTIHARVRNLGNRDLSIAQGKKGSFLAFRADTIQIDPVAEPKQVPSDGTVVIRSTPIALPHGRSMLVSAEANPGRAVMELSWDNNTGYCPLVVR